MNKPRCPLCGAELEPTLLGPDTTPWLCEGCSRGWWDAELTAEARRAFDPLRRDHGDKIAKVLAAIDQERAKRRGNNHK